MRPATRLGLLMAAPAVAIILGLILALEWAPIPSFDQVRKHWRPSEAQLLDRHGQLLAAVRRDSKVMRLAWTPLGEVSPAMLRAVVTAEDHRFFSHRGVDPRALGAAFAGALVGHHRRGASTISMQVAWIVTRGMPRPRSARTIWDKLDQIALALALERRWSKGQILEAYLNLVDFRGEIEGISAAARLMAGKTPDGLSQPEAAALAALLRSPNASPGTVLRRARALAARAGFEAAPGELNEAVARTLAAGTDSRLPGGLAPHLARHLLSSAKPGEAIQCTLDINLQRLAIALLRRQLIGLRAQNVADGAVLVVDNQTGEVLAYVGGSGDLSAAPWVDGVRAHRQAGSTLKPFLYEMALEDRLLTAATLLEDAPLDLPVAGGLYRPNDYDREFRGLVSMRTALAGSLNVPAVRTIEMVGYGDFLERLRSLDFEGLMEAADFYGPALALGSADVSLWELVGAYRALARGGMAGELRVRHDTRGVPDHRVMSPAAVFVISDILSDRQSRSVTFGLENILASPFWSAVKTGTSKDMRDNWCVGYTARFTVGVWIGNFSGEPMHDVSGISGAAPIWLEMTEALERIAGGSPEPSPPPGVVQKTIDFPPTTEPERAEWFLEGTEPPTARTVLATNQHIAAPADGTTLAIDPDIPWKHQRLAFEAQNAAPTTHWMLDHTDLGAATGPILWAPHPGHHTLTLVNADKQELDSVSFDIRGVVK